MVMIGVHAELPNRCIKCNAPSNGRPIALTVYWQRQFTVAITKSTTLRISLCRNHYYIRIKNIIGGGTCALVGLVLIFGTLAFPRSDTLLLLGLLLFSFGVVWGTSVGCVAANRINAHWIGLRGAGPAFLESLGDFPKAAWR